MGGAAVVVSQVANYLAQQGVEVSLWTLGTADGKERLLGSLAPSIRLVRCKPSWGCRVGFSRELGRTLGEMQSPDLVHIHGLWRLHYDQVARYAQKNEIPIVLSTHGMLEGWALGHRKWLKRVARILYQDRILETVTCLHTSSQEEANTIRKFGFRRPIAIIPLGVEVPARREKEKSPTLWKEWKIPVGKRRALFLSRLHPKKGLDRLLNAWSRVQPRFSDWVLMVAGYDEKGYQAKMINLARKLGIRKSVFFLGPVQGQEKEEVFGLAELFVLPSFSENFGLVVAEAMARGIPVITTKGTPWSKIAEWGCGWWAEIGAEGLAQALGEAMTKTPEELEKMGKIGREEVERHLSLEAFGRAMMEMYQWMLGQKPRPSFVQDAAGQ